MAGDHAAVSRADMLQRQACGVKLSSSQKRYEQILKRGDPDRCSYCYVELTDSTRSIDHVRALAVGGTNDLPNLVLACRLCNNRKGDMTVKAFRGMIRLRPHHAPRKHANRPPKVTYPLGEVARGDDLRRVVGVEKCPSNCPGCGRGCAMTPGHQLLRHLCLSCWSRWDYESAA